MFERYTERARRVLFFARYEASEFGSLSIDVDHLLLGLLRDGGGLVRRIFEQAGLSLAIVRDEIERRTPPREKVATSVEIPFTTEAQQAVRCTAEEADRLRHSYIGPEHLLLGILREGTSPAARMLNDGGITLDGARQQIVAMLQAPEGTAEGPGLDPITAIQVLVNELGRITPLTTQTEDLLDRIRAMLDSLRSRLKDEGPN
jgi:ATP-dependent Clp protease ATP-binding subunit ClpC